mgnify:CR=1 FL=1
MRIEITAKNSTVGDKLKELVEKKISKLDKYFEEDADCKIALKQEGKLSKMEVSIVYKGTLVRAEVSGENFYDDIDAVLPKIEKQIYKQKSKISAKLKKDAFFDKQLFFQDANIAESKLVKTKTFELTPMSTDEAITQLDLLGHSFYIFQDIETNEVRVVYLRESGDVGLIIPRKSK